jgi:hypothetical protein
VLVRGLETPDGRLIDGRSLCVDHLLSRTGSGTVAALDRSVGERPAWDADSLLRLAEAGQEPGRRVFRSGRVGLSLKRAGTSPEMPRFVLRPYRYLTEPRRIGKGKPLLVLALHAAGTDPETIRRLTGCPRQAVRRYVEDFEAGRRLADLVAYHGLDLKPQDLCRMHGTWHALWGTVPVPGRA